MRKKLVTLLLLGMLMTAAACSGKDVADEGAPSDGSSQVKSTAQPKSTPEPGDISDSKATPKPKQMDALEFEITFAEI